MATTKRERQKAARRVKMEAMQKRAKRRQNMRRGIIVGIVAVVVLGTGALLFAGKSPTTTTTTSRHTARHDDHDRGPATARRLSHFSALADPSPAGTGARRRRSSCRRARHPTKPEPADLITGTGAGALDRRQVHGAVQLADVRDAKGHPVIMDPAPSPPPSKRAA